ncbi:hypothetical protein PsorP6_018461 [Peronosclerospora sorghi]|nr:hypothetical protein PsorP6_018461 [Peronosclerospora sorghi]
MSSLLPDDLQVLVSQVHKAAQEMHDIFSNDGVTHPLLLLALKLLANKDHLKSSNNGGKQDDEDTEQSEVACSWLPARDEGMPLEAKEKVRTGFSRGRVKLVVATVAFGMGLTRKNVRAVVHFHLPSSVEAYVQQIGRAGRYGSFLVALLASRVFRPGGIVKGVVRLVSNQQNSHAHSEISHVVAQVHGHDTVDSNILTLPLLDVRLPETASNDHQKSVEHEVSRDAVLMEKINAVLPDSELQVATSECPPPADALSLGEAARKETAKRCTREFAIALPTKMCPSFRGTSARVFYVVSITAQCASSGSKPISVHLPFDVYGSEYYFAANNTVASGSQLEASKDHDSGNSMKAETSVESRAEKPVGVLCQSNQVAFELRPSLMHGRVETELLQRAQTSIFTIGKENSHLVRFLLTKQFYQPGDVLLGMFDFTRASIP